MFFSVYDSLRGEVGFDDVFEGAIISQQAQLDDMVAELFPLHGLVAVDIDLFEEINQGEGDFVFEFFVFFVVVKVFEHDGNKFVDG